MQAVIPFPDIHPEIFSISIFGFELALRWYAMAYIVGLLLGFFIIARAIARPALWPNNTAPMTKTQLEDLLTWVIIGVILGGRLGFVLFYRPVHYANNPGDILKVWEGGMAFHGGLLGVVIALILYCRRNGLVLLSAADALALATAPGLFFGRIANFINGELWGRPTDVPWAVIFPDHRATQFCPDSLPCGRHPSQLYEAGLEGLVLGLIILFVVTKRDWLKVPGRTAGLFFLGYGVARFIVEFFRQADIQFVSPENPVGFVVQFFGTGVTMGQVLSLPMVAFGLILIAVANRRAA